MGFFGAIGLRLKATSRCTDLLEHIQTNQVHGQFALWEFLVRQAEILSCPTKEDNDWPDIFYQIILWQLHVQYTSKGKSLDSEDALIIKQAVGYALSQNYSNDTCVDNFLEKLPIGV